MSKFVTSDHNFAGVLYYSYPDSYQGVEQSTRNPSSQGVKFGDFVFNEPDEVFFQAILGHYHSPESVVCENTKHLLQCVQFMRQEIVKFKDDGARFRR